MSIAEKILDNIDSGIIVVDELMRIQSMNNWFTVYVDIDTQNAKGKFLTDIFELSRLDVNTIERYIKSTLLLKTPGFITPMTHGDLFKIPYLSVVKSDYVYMQNSVKFVYIEEGLLGIIITDKTSLMSAYNLIEQKKNNLEVDLDNLAHSKRLLETEKSEIEFKAYYDELTKLPNRRLLLASFEKKLAMVEKDNSTFAILFFDLDAFKEINDSLGHDVGDALLVAVANKLKAYEAESDCIARLGGDEFVMLLSSTQNKQETEQFVQKMIDEVAQEEMILGHYLQITISVGMALCPQDGNTIKTLLKRADTALYAAKARGKNRYAFFE